MKRFIAGFLSCVLLMMCTTVFAEQINAVLGKAKIIINGELFDQETLEYDKTTYVPLNAIAESLNAEVIYNATTKTVYIDAKTPKPTPAAAVKPPVLVYELRFNRIENKKDSNTAQGWEINFKNDSAFPVTDFVAVAKFKEDGKIVRLYCYDYVGLGKQAKATTKPDDDNGMGVNVARGAGSLEIQSVSYTVVPWEGEKTFVTYDYVTQKYTIKEER